MHPHLPLAWSFIILFALCMYIVLDGFDLGVGILLLGESREVNRDLMVRSIAPVWDGNETWVVLVAVAFLGGFPLAYGVLLSAFYLPIVGMLLCLALRGTAFEFRFQTVKHRHIWDITFGVGSIGAALFQGLVVGGLASGVKMQGEAYAGSALDCITPFSIFTGIGLICGYATLGALWLSYRMRGTLQRNAAKRASTLVPGFALFALAGLAFAARVQPRLASAWRPVGFVLVPVVVLLCGSLCIWQVKNARRVGAFLSGIAMFLAVYGSAALAFWPYVIPFHFTLWQVASPENSQMVLLVGVSLAIPVVLAYSGYAYYVFRGPVTPDDPDPVNYVKELEGNADI